MVVSLKAMIKDPKQRAASISVIAAAFLVVLKLYVGVITNSLGILSEALHSTLDFVAAFITMVAVVSAAKPADEDHHYGHGKAENFSALVETILLLITCFWIFLEAYNRIVSSHLNVDPSLAAFATMGISVLVDIVNSRILYATARKYKSQALEADALHFSSDILSSSVVIVGLVFVRFEMPLGDPFASIGVAVLVLVASLRLGKRTFDHLMDRAPAGKMEEIKSSIESIEGVEIERIRVRPSGPYSFVDVKLSVDRRMPLESSRDIVTEVETRIWNILGGADIVVQVEPRESSNDDYSSKISGIAMREKHIRNIHDIKVLRRNGEISVDLHLELDSNMSVQEAHELVTRFEDEARSQLGIKEITTHMETYRKQADFEEDLTDKGIDVVRKIREIARRYPEIKDCHGISVRKTEGKTSVNLHCELGANETLEKAHELTTALEHVIRQELIDIDYVTIHVEPREDGSGVEINIQGASTLTDS